MIEQTEDSKIGRNPDFWYAIPHGYVSIDLDPSIDRISNMLEQVGNLRNSLRDHAERVLRFYAAMVTDLNAHNVRACAFGLHPDESGNANMSVLTVSMFPADGIDARFMLAEMSGMADGVSKGGMRPLELPEGIGYLSEEERRGSPSRGAVEDGEDPFVETFWQGTVAVVEPGGADIIVLQLVTPALWMVDEYRSILLGVSHTLTFTDPSTPRQSGSYRVPPQTSGSSSVAAAVQEDFG